MSLDGPAAVSSEMAFDRAYEAHWNDVFRFALAWTNDWGAAEDVAQEAFVRLWRHRSTIDWSRSARPWLLVAARRLATDRFRLLRRMLAGTPSPATLTAETADRWLDVQRAMGGLSGRERASLVLTAIEGLDPIEAAELIGTTPGAIRAAVSRARAKLEVVR